MNLTNMSSFSYRSAAFFFSFLLALATFIAPCVVLSESSSIADNDSATKETGDASANEAERDEDSAGILDLDDEEYETEEERLRALKEKAQDYKAMADANLSAGLAGYGSCLEKGEGVEKNITLAVEYYKRAADLGSEEGCLSYGRCKLYGFGCVRDGKEAVKYLLRIAGPDADDAAFASDDFERFANNPTDHLRALRSALSYRYEQTLCESELFETSFDHGFDEPLFLTNLADVVGLLAPRSVLIQTVAFEGGGSGVDSSIVDAAYDGNPQAQYLLAEHYANSGDLAESLRWLKRAAYGGEDRAMAGLANYYKDQGVLAQEARWLFERTMTGSPGAALALGSFYLRQSNNNNLTRQDRDRYKRSAEVWFGLAANIGDGEESNTAARMFQLASGKPFKQNATTEVKTIRRIIRRWEESYSAGGKRGVITWTLYRIARIPMVKFSPQAGGGTAPQAGGGTAPQAGGGTDPQTGGGTASQAGDGTAPQTGGGTAPQAGGGTAPQTGGGTAPQSGGGTAPQSGGGTVPHSGGGTVPHSGGGTAPKTGGGTTPQGEGGWKDWAKRRERSNDNQYVGDFRWPGGDGPKKNYGDWGFGANPVAPMTLEKGTMLQRYGTPKNGDDLGLYLAPLGTPFDKSSLPEEQKDQRFRAFEVIKPFTMLGGLTEPWFEQPGLGMQFLTLPQAEVDKINSETDKEKQDKMINDLRKEWGIDALIAKGYIREVYRMEDRSELINSDKHPGKM